MPILTQKTLKPTKKRLRTALEYVEQEWPRLSVKSEKDEDTLIGLPNPYIVPSVKPNNGFVYKEMYYWDSFFVVLAFCASGKVELAKGIVDNMLHLIDRFGMVPNANRFYMLSRSQPPYLTSMIRAVYDQTQDKTWLKKAVKHAHFEYEHVWMGTQQPHNRQVFSGLSRFYDINMLHQLAEAESGWDYTPRFANRCLDFLPIDLNSLLYKYEQDFAWIAHELGDDKAALSWGEEAKSRAESMRTYLWSDEHELFLDYDFVNQEHAELTTLASFMPLYVGLATETEAAEAHERLVRFETNFGLSTTDLSGGASLQKQWGLPNGWAPLHYFVVTGLQRYGYDASAKRVAKKWLKLNLKTFERTGMFYEKYNVIRGNERALEGVYPAQVGFAWTNAVFALLAEEFDLAA